MTGPGLSNNWLVAFIATLFGSYLSFTAFYLLERGVKQLRDDAMKKFSCCTSDGRDESVAQHEEEAERRQTSQQSSC